MKIYTLSTGDAVYKYYKSIVIPFAQPRKVVSTAVVNGGYRDDLTAVFNNDCNPGAGLACALRAPSYQEHMELLCAELGVDPAQTAGMLTAASMDNAAIHTVSYDELTVTAIVTGGVEVNGGRVGDPADYYKPLPKGTMEKPGTINIILVIDADLPPGVMTRALVTCTEAKTAALQELQAGSNYSCGLATGSGTDQTMVIANPASALYFESAGKHSKLGELIGKAVLAAVKEALDKQTGLSPQQQYSMLRRLKRYGVREEGLWEMCRASFGAVSKAVFLAELYAVDRETEMVIQASLFVHLLDQQEWQLLTAEEVRQAGQNLLCRLAKQYEIAAPVLQEAGREACLRGWQELVVAILQCKLARERE